MPMGQLCSTPQDLSPRGHPGEPLYPQHNGRPGTAPNEHMDARYPTAQRQTPYVVNVVGNSAQGAQQSSTTSNNTGNTRDGAAGEVISRPPPDQVEQEQPANPDTDAPIVFTIGKLIGQGAFGRVYQALKENGEIIAVKQVALAREASVKVKVSEHIMSLEKEVNLLKNLRMTNIVQYLGTSRTDDTLNIFLEFVSGGSIASLIEKFGPLPESVVRVYTKQILRGLEYLHQRKIMHRDIKARDFLLLCFNRVPKERPNATRLLKHPWMLNTVIPSDAITRSLDMRVDRRTSTVKEDQPSTSARPPGGPPRNTLPRTADPAANVPPLPLGQQQQQRNRPPMAPQASPRINPSRTPTTQQPVQSSNPEFTSGPLSRNLKKMQKSQVLQASTLHAIQQVTRESGTLPSSVLPPEGRPTSAPPAPTVATPAPEPQRPTSPDPSLLICDLGAESSAELPRLSPVRELSSGDELAEYVAQLSPPHAASPVRGDEPSGEWKIEGGAVELTAEDVAAVVHEPQHVPDEHEVRSSMLTLNFNPIEEPSWLPTQAIDINAISEENYSELSASSPLEHRTTGVEAFKPAAHGLAASAHIMVLDESVATDSPVESAKWRMELESELETGRRQHRANRASAAQPLGQI
eukprot:gene17482-23788_t